MYILLFVGALAVAWGRSEAVPSGSSLGRAEAESPAAAKSIDALLSEAGDLGYDVAPLRNKLLEGRAKGKSDEAILKALRLRMYKMESSAQLNPSRDGFERALFLLEASPKNAEGKLAMDGKSTKPEKKVSSPPVSHSRSAREKTKSVQTKMEPVWMPARVKAKPPETPGSGKGRGLSHRGDPKDSEGLPGDKVMGKAGERGAAGSPPGLTESEKGGEMDPGKIARTERRDEKLETRMENLQEGKLEKRQEKLETRLERKQEKLEDKEKVLEKKVKALEKALEKNQKRRGRP